MILDLLKLLITIPFVLVLPGFFLMLAIFGWKSRKISFFERAVLTVPLSLVSVNLIVLVLGRAGIPIEGLTLIGSILIFALLSFSVFQFRFKNKPDKAPEKENDSDELFNFSFWQTIFALLAIGLSIFIRTAYLTDTIVPSATDLGHHMYWSQSIIDSGMLPNYGMPDFIIGEHIIFAVINLLSGASVISAMPVLVLFFFNVFSFFALAILLGRLFKNRNIAVVSLFVVGVLYAINAPQGKYVSGGVVGNIIGNLIIPVSIYFLYRAFKKKDQIFAGFFLFSLLGLLYTHHLSALVLIFSVAAISALYLIFNYRRALMVLADWIKVFLKPFAMTVLVLALFFLVFAYTPSYFNIEAVDEATGAPSKLTRTGLNLDQMESAVGSSRLILGLLGFLIIFSKFKFKKLKHALVLGWAAILFLMTYKPGLLFIDIPSGRVGNYFFLPLVLLSSYALVIYFQHFRSAATKFFSTVLLFTLIFFIITDGLADSAEAFKQKNRFPEAVQTFHSARYLADTVDPEKDVILKDHVNIYADSWFKLFFMKDYDYPLSRGYLFRYDDPTKPRETCTRDMIGEPQSEIGRACFDETGVNYVVLDAQLEGDSFEKYENFSKVYSSNAISIFKRN